MPDPTRPKTPTSSRCPYCGTPGNGEPCDPHCPPARPPMPDTPPTPGAFAFVCLWCFAVSDDPAVYRHPLEALAGYDDATGEPLCEGCVDAAREGANDDA